MPASRGSSSSLPCSGWPPPVGPPAGQPDSTCSPRSRSSDPGRKHYWARLYPAISRASTSVSNVWPGPGDLVTSEPRATKVKLSVLAAVGVFAGVGAVWLAAHQPPGRSTEPGPLLTLLVGASLVGCGLASWRARPENRVGKIMVFTGFAWFTGLLVDATPPWLNTLGLAVQALWIVGLVYLLLSFPSGRLQGRLERWLLAGGAAVAVGLQLIAMLYGTKA